MKIEDTVEQIKMFPVVKLSGSNDIDKKFLPPMIGLWWRITDIKDDIYTMHPWGDPDSSRPFTQNDMAKYFQLIER